MTTPQTHEFPKLPESRFKASYGEGNLFYTEEQIRAYGQACYDAALKTSPVQADIETMLGLLEGHEWAENVAQTEVGKRMESAITELVGRMNQLVQAEAVG